MRTIFWNYWEHKVFFVKTPWEYIESKLLDFIKCFLWKRPAEEVGQALIEKLKPIKAFVHTLTADNGKEFAYHQKVSFELETDFYFATPYHSWERGLNEHTNGLVRQYFPKTQSFLDTTSKDIKEVETLLNNRPRKALNFETPIEAFSRLSKNMLYLGTQ